MRKHILFFVLFFCIFAQVTNVNAKETDSSKVWGENTQVFNKGFTGQEPVSDNKFQQTLKMMKERSLTKKQKKIKEQITPLSPYEETDYLNTYTKQNIDSLEAENSHTVMIPVKVYNEEGNFINPGYYRLSYRKLSKDEYVIDLSQGANKLISVKAFQTKEDLNQESISFGNAEIIDNSRIRLIYGNIDLNLVGYLYFK